MPKSKLSPADQRAHDLHMQGFPVSRIAGMTGRTESDVRTVVVGGWYEDKLAAKAAKLSRKG